MANTNYQHQKDGDSSSPKLILYSYWQSSCSWRLRFALKLKGLSYEYRAVNLSKGEQFKREFKNVNPLCYVPVLVDGDVVVSDSYAILLYLEEKCPGKRALLPADLPGRALNHQVAGIVTSSIQPLHMLGVLKYFEEKLGPRERMSWAQSNINKDFIALEALLKGSSGRYATGEQVSMADVFLGPQIAVAIARFDIDMSKFPTLRKLFESLEALPEFVDASPERQPDALEQ